MRQYGTLYRATVVVLCGFGLFSAGCMSNMQGLRPGPAGKSPVPPPPPGSIPRELEKIALPEYVLEPPDVLRIEAVLRDVEEDPVTKKKILKDTLRSMPLQPVWGEYTIRPDGTVFLGVYGQVNVAGYTLKQAAAAIRETLARQAFAEADGVKQDSLLVVLDVTQYNSKKYYVITDGGGAGEQIFAFPVTGSETVLDALSNIYGLPSPASKRDIWVARRTPHAGQQEQILHVDYVAMTQHGETSTNYQIMPGDRVYVKAQRLVILDTKLARIISPIERIFGVTLLGTSAVNQIGGRGNGFNGNN